MSSGKAARQAAANVPKRRRKPAVKWIGAFEDLPAGLRDNDYIRRGYRLGHSWKDVLWSAFTWHNETGNIHTHLLGFALFCFLTVAAAFAAPAPFHFGSDAFGQLETRLHQLRAGNFSHMADFAHMRQLSRLKFVEWEDMLVDAVGYGRDAIVNLPPRALRVAAAVLQVEWPTARWPLYVFLAGAMMCLFTSALCHLLACCSVQFTTYLWRYDYLGITVLTVASFFPPVYYGFICYPRVQLVYLFVTTALGVLCSLVSLMDFFQHYRFRAMRAAMFASLGLWGVVPFVHGWQINAQFPLAHKALYYEMWMGIIYLLGAAVYAMRIPERWRPGKFDYMGNSHQIFHLAVVIAALCHYRSVTTLIRWRDMAPGCPAVNAAGDMSL